MSLRDPVGQARQASTRLQAARLHQTFESELALNDELPDDQERDLDEAVGILNTRAQEMGWGDLRDADPAGGGAQGWVAPLSTGARKSLRAADVDTSDARAVREHVSRRRRGGPGRRGAGRARRGSPLSTPRRARSQLSRGAAAVAPGPIGVTAGLAWDLFAAGVGLSLFYLLLTRSTVTTKAITGIGNGFRRLASPYEDLIGAPKATAATAARPAGGGLAADAARGTGTILDWWANGVNTVVPGLLP